MEVATKSRMLLFSYIDLLGGRRGGIREGEWWGELSKQMFPSFFKPKRQDIRQHLKEQLGTLNKYRHLNVNNYIHMLEFLKED